MTADEDFATDLLPSLPPAASARFVLTVVEGPDQGKSFTLDGSLPSRLLVGQSPACELRLTDPLVSRRHFALDVSDNELRITDLGSTNRTYANGLVVSEAYLRGGEVVRVGSTVLRVDVDALAEAAPLSRAKSFGRVTPRTWLRL